MAVTGYNGICERFPCRHSLKKFGGPNTILFLLHPKFERIDSGDTPPLYCNFKNRSDAFGISFGRHFSVDGEFRSDHSSLDLGTGLREKKLNV